MLSFIGTGSAFNTSLGNNNAYIKKGESLLLIDCGSSTFAKIQERNLLEGIKRVFVLMTHTHPDHVGSLGDLIFYGYYAMGEMGKPSVTVIAPMDLHMEDVLNTVGVKRETYWYYPMDEPYTWISNFSILIEPVRVVHVEELNCYGYTIRHKEDVIYYSGDSCNIPSGILDKLNMGAFDAFYQDTCKADYDGNVHLSLRKLTEMVKPEYRKRVFCMHLDNGFNIEEAKEIGFNVVSST